MQIRQHPRGANVEACRLGDLMLGRAGRRDSEEVVPNRPLANLEDHPHGQRQQIPASRAFPQLAGHECVNLEATAFVTLRFAVVITQSDPDELGLRLTIQPQIAKHLAHALQVDEALVAAVMAATARQQRDGASERILARETAYTKTFTPHLRCETARDVLNQFLSPH